MRVDGPDVSFKMLATMKTLSAAFDIAHVHARVLRAGVVGGPVGGTELCGHPAATAFLCEVGDGYREYDA